MNKEQRDIVEKYILYGVLKGGELLLPKNHTIRFIEELANVEVQINGCDLWRYLDSSNNPNRIVSLLGDGFLVRENLLISLTGDNSLVHENGVDLHDTKEDANKVREYIEMRLPKDADLISLVFEDGEIYDFLRMKEK